MNPRERIAQTLRGAPVDRVARGEFFIADEFARASCPAAETLFEAQRQIIEQFDLDVAAVSLSAGWGALEQPPADRALEMLMRWRAETDRFVWAVLDGPFSAAARARGFQALMHYIHGAPHVARDLFWQGAEEARLIAQAVRDAGADGVVLGEDIAYGARTYLAPKDLRELYFPALRAAAHEIRNLGLVVFFHSDGNLNAVLADLAACELDGVQGLEPEAGMTLSAARAQTGAALTLWGNFGFEFLSAARTEAEIAEVVRAVTASPPVIAGSCGGLVPGLNPATLRQIYCALG